jgi:type 1 glutamine amidotransferase
MSSSTDPIMTAVITGNHPFEVVEFTQLFRQLPGVDFYPQYLENWVDDMSNVRDKYEAILFYNMHIDLPNEKVKAALESLGEVEQGILFLHHGMLGFPKWRVWSDIIGIQNRSFGYSYDQTVRVQITDPDHPITRGLSPWEMIDEIYTMDEAGPGSHVLLTTDHPKSLRTLAWTRQHEKSRVFVLASGHDKKTYANPNFQTVLLRGIQWASGRI